MGSVELRIVGVTVTKVQVVDRDEHTTDLETPMLAVQVEVRLSAKNKKRVLSSWTDGGRNYGVMFLENSRTLAPAKLPAGNRPNTGAPIKQPIPEDGTPVSDVLLFAVPPAGSGELSLRLEGDRCGEATDIWFKIPASALKK